MTDVLKIQELERTARDREREKKETHPNPKHKYTNGIGILT